MSVIKLESSITTLPVIAAFFGFRQCLHPLLLFYLHCFCNFAGFIKTSCISGNAIEFTSALIDLFYFQNKFYLRLDFPKLTKIGLKLYS
jgi:hypothetical protein